jgi:hypothetical protein
MVSYVVLSDKMVENDKLQTMQKEFDVAYFKVLF